MLTRSAGAVANALDKLTALGVAQMVTDKPRSCRLAPAAPAPAPDAAGVLLAAVITIISIFLLTGLLFYAMHRSKPSRLRLSASVLKLVSFSIQVESDDRRGESPPSDRPERGRHRHDASTNSAVAYDVPPTLRR